MSSSIHSACGAGWSARGAARWGGMGRAQIVGDDLLVRRDADGVEGLFGSTPIETKTRHRIDHKQMIVGAATEIQRFISGRAGLERRANQSRVRAAFNPNLKTSWFSAMTQVINQITAADSHPHRRGADPRA